MTNLASHTANDLAPLEALFPEKLHQTLRDMAIECYLFILEDFDLVDKLGRSQSAELVMGQIERLAMKLGGAQFYLPKDIKLQMSKRNRAIVAEYNGRNMPEVTKKYRLSDMRIRQLVRLEIMIERRR
jgi:Mor family transcriptional regulator